MIDKHIPDVMNTGMFLSYSLQKVLGSETTDSVTYAVQYLGDSMESYEIYQATYAKNLQAEHQVKFEGKFAAFRSLMSVISHSS